MQRKPLIAVQIEKNRAHGRAMLEGIANYVLELTEWRLVQVEPQSLTDAKYLSSFDGFIVRVMDERTADALLESGKPAIDTYGRIDRNPLPSIRLDDSAIAEMAASCFHEHRFVNCAYCGFQSLRFSDARGETFTKAMCGFGATVTVYDDGGKSRLKDTFFRNEQAERIADHARLRSWVKSLPKPVAIFCCNDLRAYHVLKVCEEAGITVPNDVAVLGVDNDTLLCTFTNPPLSSIDTDSFNLGREAAEMLASEMINGHRGQRTPRTELHPPRRTVERLSTEIHTFHTPYLSDAVVFIRRHFCDGISASDVVKHIGFSHTAINRAFNAELGTSVQQEIIRIRLERACQLLKETDLTAAEIAKQCGYPSAQYFSHFFSCTYKVTPDNWRRQFSR